MIDNYLSLTYQHNEQGVRHPPARFQHQLRPPSVGPQALALLWRLRLLKVAARSSGSMGRLKRATQWERLRWSGSRWPVVLIMWVAQGCCSMMRLSEAAHDDAQVVCSGWRHMWLPLEYHCVSFVYSECTQRSTLKASAASTKPGNGAMAKAIETITGWSSKNAGVVEQF